MTLCSPDVVSPSHLRLPLTAAFVDACFAVLCAGSCVDAHALPVAARRTAVIDRDAAVVMQADDDFAFS